MNGLQSGERKAQFFEPCGIDFGCMFHRSMRIGARGGRFFDRFDTFSAFYPIFLGKQAGNVGGSAQGLFQICRCLFPVWNN